MAERIRRWISAEWPFLLTVGMLVAAVAYLLVFHHHWRRGVSVIAAGLLVGAVLRAVLPPQRVGLLGVRGRVLDTVGMAVTGGVILSVAIRLH